MPLVLQGATSGQTTINPTDAVTATLTLPSSTGTLLSTANPQSGGVIQVVQGTTSTQVINATQTFADTGLTATITPKFSTSKILIFVNHNQNSKTDGNLNNDMSINLCRNGISLLNLTNGIAYTGTTLYQLFSVSACYQDSPATTSPTTYKTQFKNNDNNGADVRVQNSNTISTITLMEIAA